MVKGPNVVKDSSASKPTKISTRAATDSGAKLLTKRGARARAHGSLTRGAALSACREKENRAARDAEAGVRTVLAGLLSCTWLRWPPGHLTLCDR